MRKYSLLPSSIRALVRSGFATRSSAPGFRSRSAALVGAVVAVVSAALLLYPLTTRGEASSAAFRAASSGDTTVVHGPMVLGTPNGATTWHIEEFALSDTASTHELLIEFGDSAGMHRPQNLRLYFQHYLVAEDEDFVNGVQSIRLPVVARGLNSLKVEISGSAGDFVRTTLYSVPTTTVTIFGPESYTAFVHTFDTISLPPGVRAPYYLSFAGSDSASEIHSIVKLNGTNVFNDYNLHAALAEVELQAVNELEVKLVVPVGSSGTIHITGTDDIAPVLTVSTPLDSTITSDPEITVTGSVEDATSVALTIDGQPVSLGGGGAFSASVTLANEGENTLTLLATDAAGNTTELVLHVIRDATPPALSVTSPEDGFVTRDDSVVVSGTAMDIGHVDVAANGYPLATDAGGAFSGGIPLDIGANSVVVTATDAAGNQTAIPLTVVRDTAAPAITVTSPAHGATVDAEQVTVSGTVTDATTITLTINTAVVTLDGAGAFSTDVNLASGPNTIRVEATDAAGNVAFVELTVTRSGVDPDLPPDPATVAPPLDPTVATNMAAASSFLYTGANPIQRDVAVGAVDPVRVSVLRGRIIDRDGNPLPGARIEIKDHPELGHTLSRADGMYDLAVNGGGQVTVDIRKDGYLRAQRQTNTGWQKYARVADVALVPLDPQVTSIDLTQPGVQVARGSVVTDEDGTRQATLLIEPGTSAELVMPDGSSTPVTSLNVRATEYTVGPNGPSAMPGVLPPQSAYTYAVELSADEAIEAGATSVRFSQPLPFYVDNFLDLPVGTAVPLGYYDYGRGVWVADHDGVIVRVHSVSAGVATLDIDGDSVPDDDTRHSELGITMAEREQLASLYGPGHSLWRVGIRHFTPFDLNYLIAIGATWFEPMPVRADDRTNEPTCRGGSIIECENQTLGEAVSLVGTPFNLSYRSNRTPGNAVARTITIPVSGSTVPFSLQSIYVRVEIAGNVYADTFPPQPDQYYEFTWDGNDAYGRSVQGRQPIHIAIGYAYIPGYGTFPQDCLVGEEAGIFGRVINCTTSETYAARQLSTVWRERTSNTDGLDSVESWDARSQGLGGWTLNVHHAYDPAGRVLHMGDGSRRSADDMSRVISTAVGRNTPSCCGGYNGDDQPAVDAMLWIPQAVAFAPDGSYYIADQFNHRVRRVAPDGQITTVAGTGQRGLSPDGLPATQSHVEDPTAVAVGPDGTLYIAASSNHRIQSVGRDGVMRTVAGATPAGEWGGYSGDEGLAREARLEYPQGVAVAADGSIYISDTFNHRVRRVGPDGMISTVAGLVGGSGGSAASGLSPDSVLARGARLSTPMRLAAAPDGNVYFAETDNALVRRITPDGLLVTVAGGGACGPGVFRDCGNGGPASEAVLDFPRSVALGRDGSVYISDQRDVRRVAPEGTITTIAGRNDFGFGDLSDGGAAPAALLGPTDVAVAPGGALYVTDETAGRVRSIAPVMPGFANVDLALASSDGTEIYQFSAVGRHLRTIDAMTGASLYTFAYDTAGSLMSITDADGLTTLIERDTNGKATAIVGHYGQRTELGIDADGFLAELTGPGSETVALGYATGGLLTSFTDPRGNTNTFTYNDVGRLLTDADPAGGTQTLTRELTPLGSTATLTTAMGRVTTYSMERLPTGEEVRATVDPAGLVTRTTQHTDGTVSTVGPDSTRSVMTTTGGPRFGMQSPMLVEARIITPSGLASVIRNSRSVTLTDPGNPLSSIVSQVDSTVVNGTRVSTSAFDGASRTIVTTSPEGRQTSVVLDEKGRVLETRIPGFTATLYSYDADGRLELTSQGARSTSLAYGADGLVASATDALSRTSSFEYDSAGRVVRQVLPDSSAIDFDHDAAGNLVSLAPPARPAHQFIYNARGQDSVYAPPSVGLPENRTFYSYDADGNLSRTLRPDGLAIDVSYDSAGRPATMVLPNGTISYQYSPTTGNLTSIAAPDSASLSYTYDGGLPTAVTWTGAVAGSVAVSYNNNFEVASQTVNGGHAVAFQYDDDGLLASSGDMTLSRDPLNGLLTGTVLGNVTSAQSYNALGELSSLEYASGGTVQFHTSYTRDALGRIQQKVETVLGVSVVYDYTYDTVGRLTNVHRDSVLVESYGYDANGNRTSYTDLSGTIAGTYDDQDRLLSYGDAMYTYTANGELTSKTTPAGETTYEYDVIGNLRKVVLSDSTVIEYVIDGQNRRIGRKVDGVLVQGFLYSGQLTPAAEVDGAGSVVSRFVYGTRVNVPDYIIRGSTTYRIVSDHLGSVRLVVDVATGAIVQRIDYDAFGRETHNTAPGFQPFGYAGGIGDLATAFVRLGARDYDPDLGRWTVKDPVRFVGGTTSLYVYAKNDPLNWVDPNGLSPCECNASFTERFKNNLNVTNDFFFDGITRAARSGLGFLTSGAVAKKTGGVTFWELMKVLPKGGYPAVGGVAGTLAAFGINSVANGLYVAAALEVGIVGGSLIDAAFCDELQTSFDFIYRQLGGAP
jgi:RHS repeat-associated protein